MNSYENALVFEGGISMQEMTYSEFLKRFDVRTRTVLLRRIEMGAPAYLVLFSNVNRGSKAFGASSVIPVGPGCDIDSIEAARIGALYADEQLRQMPVAYAKVPADEEVAQCRTPSMLYLRPLSMDLEP